MISGQAEYFIFSKTVEFIDGDCYEIEDSFNELMNRYNRRYLKNGEQHRVVLPAVILSKMNISVYGEELYQICWWYNEGQHVNISGGPFTVDAGNGDLFFAHKGMLHAYDDKPYNLSYAGSMYWSVYHNIASVADDCCIIFGQNRIKDLPSIIFHDCIVYECYGVHHREDGPAVIRSDGTLEWWISGENITIKVEEWMIENDICYPFTVEEQILFRMTFYG